MVLTKLLSFAFPAIWAPGTGALGWTLGLGSGPSLEKLALAWETRCQRMALDLARGVGAYVGPGTDVFGRHTWVCMWGPEQMSSEDIPTMSRMRSGLKLLQQVRVRFLRKEHTTLPIE